MATLFFEGFEKGLVFNKLDSNYWQSQFKQYPKFAFGGYGNVFGNLQFLNDNSLVSSYQYVSPNNGILPVAKFDATNGPVFYPPINTNTTLFTNAYPGFGSPPGFIAFTNIDLLDQSSVEYPTYIQASGFALPSGTQTYFGFRSLGLETKNTDYSYYPHRHQLFAMCSGNTTGLSVNIVKATGDNLSVINGERTTIALEIIQNDNILGYFDLNISGIVENYRIAPVGATNKTLTIATTNYTPITTNNPFNSIISRWIHTEFLIDDSDISQSYLSLKVEGIDIGVINSDPEIQKEDWDLTMPINKFIFDNIRFYNRTYTSTGLVPGEYIGVYNPGGYMMPRYYMNGSVWLLDDITLIDNIGDPSFYLGPTSKVLQLVPAIDRSFVDNNGRPDGIKNWTSSYTNHRRSLGFLDADAGTIQATNSGSIDAVAFSNRNEVYTYNPILPDPNSRWRDNYNDAVGGMKVYNSARKSYLDTQFCNVFLSGISDPYTSGITVCLHMDGLPPEDSSVYQRTVYNTETVILNEFQPKFGNGNYYFPDSSSYISTSHPNFGTGSFTIDTWIKFDNINNKVNIFDKQSLLPADVDVGAIYPYYGYSLDATISGVEYTMYNLAYGGQSQWTVYKTILNYPNILNTGEWNHLSITRNSTNDYSMIVYIGGQSGTSYTEILYQSSNGMPTGTGSYNSIYYMPNISLGIVNYTNVRDLSSAIYIAGSGPISKNSLSIGRAGSLDDYVITTGVARHTENFTPPSQPFKALKDDYYQIGPSHNVSKTTYQTYQYYALKNPATNKNWTLPQISGLIFGVKKL